MKRRSQFSFPVTTLAGSSVPNFISHLRSHRIQPKYYPKFALSFIVSSLLEVFNYWERNRWDKKIREFRMRSSPVFIIGFWRSGTTLLHNLMCRDEKAGYTTTLQTIFPHIILTQKKWLKKVMKYMMPLQRPFDHMKLDADLPQEEEYGLTNVTDETLYKFLLFPGDFDRIVTDALNFHARNPKAIEKWKKEYTYFISKSMLNTGGMRYVGKNPCNMFRMKLLKDIYPDSRFIFIHRNPYQVVESLYRFTLAVFPGVQLQDVSPKFSREKIVLLYRDVIEAYFKHRTFLHPNDYAEIRMDDFLNDKIGTLRKIYKKFNLCGFEKAVPRFEEYLRENPSEEQHFYQIHPETIRLINLHAATIVRRLGYRIQQPHPEEVPEPVTEMS